MGNSISRATSRTVRPKSAGVWPVYPPSGFTWFEVDSMQTNPAFIIFLGKFGSRFQNLILQNQSANPENTSNNVPVSEVWKPLMPQEEPHGKKLAGKPKIIFFLDQREMRTDSATVRGFYIYIFYLDCQINNNSF